MRHPDGYLHSIHSVGFYLGSRGSLVMKRRLLRSGHMLRMQYIDHLMNATSTWWLCHGCSSAGRRSSIVQESQGRMNSAETEVGVFTASRMFGTRKEPFGVELRRVVIGCVEAFAKSSNTRTAFCARGVRRRARPFFNH